MGSVPVRTVERSFGVIPDDGFADVDGSRWLEWSGPGGRLDWDEILKSRRVLIVSQAGTGKTHECRERKRRLQDAGEAAFLLELAALCSTGLSDQMTVKEERLLKRWRRSQSEVATFFLDSVDEVALTHGSFRTALSKLGRAIDGQLGRTRIVITSRPVPVDRQSVEELLPIPAPAEIGSSAEEFADVAMGMGRKSEDDGTHGWRVVRLLPFSAAEMRLFAEGQGVSDADAMLRAVYRQDARDFAERPQDLMELCSQWKAFGCLGTHRDRVAADIRSKLGSSAAQRERVQLSYERAVEGAGRLTLAAILMRRLSFRFGADSERGPADGAIDPADILPDWSEGERGTLLERPLFGVAGYGRVRFHHRSVIEYLAADRLGRYIDAGKPVAAVKRLLFAETAQGHAVVRPTMRPLAAWLAARTSAIFDEVCLRDPSVLLDFGDPQSLTELQKTRALSAYVDRYGKGGWQGLHVPAVQVRRFATPALSSLIFRLWPSVGNPEVRDLLLETVAAGRCHGCLDIAFGVASSPAEPRHLRLSALEALAELDDRRLPDLTRSMETDSVAWPNDVARAAVVSLFPVHLPVPRLLSILDRLSDTSTSVGHLNYYLPERIAEAKLDQGQLEELRFGLTLLAGLEAAPGRMWPHCRSSRPFLLPALAATCNRLAQERAPDTGLAVSMVLALRLAGHDFNSNEHLKTLRNWISAAGDAVREQLFWADDAFCLVHRARADPQHRFFEVATHGAVELSSGDEGWVLAAMRQRDRPVEQRALMLVAALHAAWDGRCPMRTRARKLRGEVSDMPELVALADRWMAPVTTSAEVRRWEAEAARRQAAEEDEAAKARASWAAFWQELAGLPEGALGEARSFDTAWNLWTAMSQLGRSGRTSGWDRPFLEGNFGKAVADRVRGILGGIWRADRPTFTSEREANARNSVLVRWHLGLAAIWAEAEDPDWAAKLTAEEARLACRYAPVQLNGFPAWLDDLAVCHPREVEGTLGRELVMELDEAQAAGTGYPLLSGLAGASEPVVRLFVSRLLTWLVGNDGRPVEGRPWLADHHLRTVIDVILRTAHRTERELVCRIARERLEDGLESPMARVWLPVLMCLDPEAGTDALERGLVGKAPPSNAVGASWITGLFDVHSSSGSVRLHEGFTPKLLLRLLEIAYRHVRPEDDVHREGSWTPDARDRAEQARNVLLGALLGAEGPEAWEAKLELARKPFSTHMRDRVMAMARERSAREVDGVAQDADAVIALERRGEMPPSTRGDMFRLLVDRLDDVDDLLLGDDSPREGWATFTKERIMRRALARELSRAANGMYVVDQEAVTGDEKETDIRIVSCLGTQQAVIELKIGENGYSVLDLMDALEKQLVKRYMAPEHRRAGCLVVTSNGTKTWRHPDDGGALDFAGVMELLGQRARELMDETGGTISVTVKGLDLGSRPK